MTSFDSALYFGVEVFVIKKLQNLSIIKVADIKAMQNPSRDDTRQIIVETTDLVPILKKRN